MPPKPETLLRRLLRVSRMVNTLTADEYSRIHLSAGQPAVLLYLGENDGAVQGDLAQNLCIRPATVAINLRGMERARLIRRETDSFDLRVSRVYITERGKALLRDIRKVEKQAQERFFEGFSEAERETFIQLLGRVSDNLLDSYNNKKPG
ncbi:MAG: MarR family transcriptional regulator [Clostridia bacterium]|nr:MarR family transcriptional regulator [Clostridia bacterium]